MNKKKIKKGLWIFGATVATAATITVPIVLAVEATKNNSNSIQDYLGEIWKMIKNKISSVKSIDELESAKSELINSINQYLKDNNVDLIVSDINITLTPGSNGTQVANPITLVMDKNANIGENDDFTVNNNELISKNGIMTSISNLDQIDGAFDLSSIEEQIWQILLSNINPWNDISNQDQVQNTIKEQINAIVSPYGLEVNNVSLNLTPGGIYYTVDPAKIEFNHQISDNCTNFRVNDGSSLLSTSPISTLISTYYNLDGSLSIPDEVLKSIENLVGETASREWNKNSEVPNRLLNDPKSQLGEKIYNQLIEQLNNLLPENYPCKIIALNNVKGLNESYSVNPTESGKLVSQFIGFELVDKNTNKQINKININPTDHLGINSEYPENQPKDQLVYNNLTTAYDCFWFNDNQIEQMVDLVQDWVYNNWKNSWDPSDLANVPNGSFNELYNKLNELVKNFGALPNYTPSIMTTSEIGSGICTTHWVTTNINSELINSSKYGNDVEWVRFFFPTYALINNIKTNIIAGGNNIERISTYNNSFITYGYTSNFANFGYGIFISAPTKVPLQTQNK